MLHQDFGKLRTNAQMGRQGCHRILEDHCQRSAAHTIERGILRANQIHALKYRPALG